MNLTKQDRNWMIFTFLFCVLLLAAIATTSEIKSSNDTMKLELASKDAQILELQKQLKSVDHRNDLINLCKVLMEGIYDDKCENMYNPKISLERK